VCVCVCVCVCDTHIDEPPQSFRSFQFISLNKHFCSESFVQLD